MSQTKPDPKTDSVLDATIMKYLDERSAPVDGAAPTPVEDVPTQPMRLPVSALGAPPALPKAEEDFNLTDFEDDEITKIPTGD